MKKRGTTIDAKRAAANDKPEAETKKADAAKATKAEKPAERYQIGQTDTVKRGFLKELFGFRNKSPPFTTRIATNSSTVSLKPQWSFQFCKYFIFLPDVRQIAAIVCHSSPRYFRPREKRIECSSLQKRIGGQWSWGGVKSEAFPSCRSGLNTRDVFPYPR